MSRFLPLFMLLLVATPLVRGEPISRHQLPATTAWFVHIDLDAARASSVAVTLRDGWMQQPEAGDVLRKIQENLGIDPARDIRSITLYGITFAPDQGVLIIRGKVDQPRLITLLNKNPGHRTEFIGGHSLHFWDEPILPHDPGLRGPSRTMAGAIFKDDTVVIGPDTPSVITALDVLDEKAACLSGSSPLATPAVAGTVIQAAATGLAEARGLPIQSPIIRQCESGSLMLGERDGQVFVSGRLVTQSGETASQIKSLIEGARAMAQLQASDNADVARLLQPVHVSAEDKVVELNWKLSSVDLMKMIEAWQTQKSGATQPRKNP